MSELSTPEGPPKRSRRQQLRDGRRYLQIAAAVFFVLGAFHLILSVLGIWLKLFAVETTEIQVVIPNAPDEGFLFTLLYAYLIFQVYLGWLVGVLTIVAGRLCLLERAHGFIKGVAIMNWFFFPAGTVVGVLAFGDLRRDSVHACFEDRKEQETNREK